MAWLPGFEQPLLLLLLPVLLGAHLLPRRRQGWLPARQRRLALGPRVAILGLLVLGLAGPYSGTPRAARAVVFGLDVSQSVEPARQAWARDWVQQASTALGPSAQVSVVEFAERARVGGQAGGALSAEATDLGAVLRLARGLLPPPALVTSDLVLLTDGWHNHGPPPVLEGGPAVSYVPLDLAPGAAEVALRSVELPSLVREGDTLDVVLAVDANVATNATLRLWLDGRRIEEREVAIAPGATQYSFAPRVDGAGFHQVRVEVVPEAGSDARVENNGLEAVTVAREGARVLVLEDRAGEGAALAALLAGTGLQTERRPAASVPPSAAGLRSFDAVVLVNTPATTLTLDQQRTLQQYVQELGRGLVVLGGPRAYAPGGYEGSVLDDVLPVSSKPPPQPQQGSVALELVVDKSASMGFERQDGVSKFEMALQAASEAAGLLQPEDTLGVVAFDTEFEWVVPSARIRGPADLQSARAQIGSIRLGGGTSIYPALQAGFQAAARADARQKHVVLLTDGQSSDRGYEELIARMRPQGITLSTVAIGSDADTRLLASLARLGEGRYYFTERAAQVPRIATKETTILTRNALVEGQVAVSVREPSPLLRGLPADLPLLRGYVATTPRDRAVMALAGDRGHPLLAHWQYGLGRVVAWTADAPGAESGWLADWTVWPGNARFLSQVVRWSLPAAGRPEFSVAARVAEAGRSVTLRAESLQDEAGFANLQDVRATVVAPDGVARELALPQQAPGLYERTLRVSQPGNYRVLFTQRGTAGGATREEAIGFAVPTVPELRAVGQNDALLRQLAARTGGRELREPRDLLAGPGAARPLGETRTPLWPLPVALGLLLLPLDVALRRLRWPWIGSR